jgi:hypothetical protein
MCFIPGPEYDDKEPTPLDLFRETHCIKVKRLSPVVQDALLSQHAKYVCLFFAASDRHAYSLHRKATMHTELSVPNEDGKRKTEAQVIFEVLSKKTRNLCFFRMWGSSISPINHV